MKRVVTFAAFVLGFLVLVTVGCASKAKPDAAVVVDAGADVDGSDASDAE